jgi:hypothetical protein
MNDNFRPIQAPPCTFAEATQRIVDRRIAWAMECEKARKISGAQGEGEQHEKWR